MRGIPDIGMIVVFEGEEQAVCQKRCGDEQSVLWWTKSAKCYGPSDEWNYRATLLGIKPATYIDWFGHDYPKAEALK